jgi:hypothetical protein
MERSNWEKRILSLLASVVAACAVPACSEESDKEETTSVTFVVTGDSRGGFGDPDGVNNEILGEIARAIVGESPDFVMFTGDMIWGYESSGPVDEQLRTWRSIMQPVYDAGIEVYPVRGNHESAEGTKEDWDAVFQGDYALPANGPPGEENLTFSFAKGDVFIVGLDQYVTLYEVNQPWLDSQFALNTKPHVFVFGHAPAFKVYHDDCLDDNVSARDAFWNSIAAEGGRTYFSGHDHFYDHSRVDDGDGDPGNDLHQFIVATAGADFYTAGPDYDGDNGAWTPERIHNEASYGYVLAKIVGPKVTLTWKHRVSAGVYQAAEDVFTYEVAY